MEVGLHPVRWGVDGGPAAIPDVMTRSAVAAEEVGFAWFALCDHFLQMEGVGPIDEPMPEGYAALGFLAGRTSTIDLGLLVTGATYRPPGVLAHTVATLDVLSGGRARLGLGAGWYEREHHALGVSFPAVPRRFAILEDTIELCRQMFSDDDGPWEGRTLSVTETRCEPRPLGPVPLLIGGGGEQRTLRLVARHADAANLACFDLAEVRHKFEVLDRWCAEEGRDPAEVERTVMWVFDPIAERDRFLREMEECAAMGVTEVMVIPPGDPVAFVDQFAEQVLPALRDL